MKLVSRKAIAAVATTVALTTAGLSAPAFAEEDPTAIPAASSELFVGSSTDGKDDAGDQGDAGTGSSEDMNVEEISDWIGVFTAIIGALSTAFGFIQRITG
ncbi:MAG: hypothetical protein GX356_12535 [Corynebacterium pollutisoli]|uniref:Secreted protein n=1 Tax=Corynebacterium pollutisoli TaxID=1610489 RepID=A0A7X8RI85_9CORY|nr:hypothetical protein [Corynebacterium pollutisoli]